MAAELARARRLTGEEGHAAVIEGIDPERDGLSRPSVEDAQLADYNERLAAEVAALTGTTKTGAVRYALRQVLLAQSRLSVRQREERLIRFLEEEIWPLVPPDRLGKPISKAEREDILGFGEYGA